MRPITGATWLDLVATVTGAYGSAPVDRLPDVAELADWLATHGLRPAAAPTAADLRRAVELREALRAVALATVRGADWPPDAVDTVNRALATDRHLTLTAGALEPPSTARAALARLARHAAEQLTGPAAATLRQCAEPVCGMLFLDPGGRRRWCAAEICGVRHRVREHRRRTGQHGTAGTRPPEHPDTDTPESDNPEPEN